jgi:hypothetical protein
VGILEGCRSLSGTHAYNARVLGLHAQKLVTFVHKLRSPRWHSPTLCLRMKFCCSSSHWASASGFYNPPGSPPTVSKFGEILLRVKRVRRESCRGEGEVNGRSPPAGTEPLRDPLPDEYRLRGSLCLPRSRSDQGNHFSTGCRVKKRLHELQTR